MSRRNRWTFEGNFPSGKIQPTFVRITSYPDLTKTDKAQSFTTIFTEYDSTEDKGGLFILLANCYKFAETMVPNQPWPEAHLGEVVLTMYGPKYNWPKPTPPSSVPNIETTKNTPMGMGIGMLGAGFGQQIGWCATDKYTLKQAWPTSISFGELDHSSSECCDIEVTWCYNSVTYEAVPYEEESQPNLD